MAHISQGDIKYISDYATEEAIFFFFLRKKNFDHNLESASCLSPCLVLSLWTIFDMLESQTPERTLVALTSKMQEKMQKSPKYELVPSFQSFGGYSTDQILTPWYSPLIESCVSWQGPF